MSELQSPDSVPRTPLAVMDDPACASVLVRALLSLLGQSGTGVALKDASGRYLYTNDAMARMVGCEGQAMLGASDADLMSLAWAVELRAADQRALAAPGVAAGEHQFEQQGLKRTLRTHRVALRGVDGVVASHILSLWSDDSEARDHAVELRQALAQIERQQVAFETLQARQREGLDLHAVAFRSSAFEEHLQREVALSGREHREFSLGLLVLDDLLTCRDAFGSVAIDRVADTIVNMLRASTRSMDMVCRLGEGRFGVLLSGVGLATSHTRLEQFRRECAMHVVTMNDHSISFSVSAGVASFPHTAGDLDALYQAADKALGVSCAAGGNRVSLAAIPMPERARGWARGGMMAVRADARQPTALDSM